MVRLQLINSVEEVIEILNEAPQANDSACVPRFGKIVSFHAAQNDRIYVEYDGLPEGSSVIAKIGRLFRHSELDLAIKNKLMCRIEFLNNDMSLPILTNIFFSVLDDDNPIVLKGKSIIIEAEHEVIIKSGKTQTKYSGRDGRVTTQAKHITSQAEKANKIQGSTISVN